MNLINIWKQIIETDKKKSLRIHLGFDVSTVSENLKPFCNKGWWHCYLLGSKKFSKQDICLNITPNSNWDNWNLTRVYNRNSGYTILNNLFGLPILRFDLLDRHKGVFKEFKGEYEEFRDLISPVYKLLNIEDEIAFIDKYLHNKNNIPDGSDAEKKYLDFLYRYDNSERHRTFREKVSEMIEQKDLMPNSVMDQDFGTWDQLFKNIIVRRAIDYSNSLVLDKLSPILWNAFVLPHGFDTVGFQLSHYPDTGTPPEILLKDIAQLLTADYYEFSTKVTDHPLYKAAQAINEKGGSYIGVEHAEAAAILDDKLNDPVGSWNALVSAAFWAGLNNGGPEMQLELWNQAIRLSKKEGWNDAHIALTHQRKIYDEIKSVDFPKNETV